MGARCLNSSNVVKTEISNLIPTENYPKPQFQFQTYNIDLRKLYLDYLDSITDDLEIRHRLKFSQKIESISDLTHSSNETTVDTIAREITICFFFCDFCIKTLKKQQYFQLIDQFITFIRMQLILNLYTFTNFLDKPPVDWEQFILEWSIPILEIQERNFKMYTECRPKGFVNIQSREYTLLTEELVRVDSFDTEDKELAKKIVFDLVSTQDYLSNMKKYCKFLEKHHSVQKAMRNI